MRKLILIVIFSSALAGCTLLKSGEEAPDPKEAYLLIPSSLPAYKQYVDPIIKNVMRQDGVDRRRENDFNQTQRWENYIKYKTWYLGPANLQSIPKDILGVSFSENENEQLAYQTDRAIWILRDAFNQMTFKEQGDLLIHEYVMGLYFLKYKSYTQLCQNLRSLNLTRENCEMFDGEDAIRPVQALKPLDAGAYQDIRRVTTFFIEKGAKAPLKDILRVLRDNNFDQRFFPDPDRYFPVHQDENFSNEQLGDLFLDAKTLNRFPDKCLFLKSGINASCAVSISDEGDFFKFDIFSADRSKVLFSQRTEKLPMYTANLIRNTISGQGYYVMDLFSTQLFKNPQLGMPLRLTMVFLQEKENMVEWGLRFNGFISYSLVLDKIYKAEADQPDLCLFVETTEVSLEKDTIMSFFDTKDLEYIKSRHSVGGLSVQCK